MISAPLLCEWTGDSFVPLKRFTQYCDQNFVVHERYRLEIVEERSHKSHAHYFAALNEAWRNLPEDLAALFPSSEHLRKRALVDAGFYDEEILDCDTPEAAERVAASFRRREEFSIVIVRGSFVFIRTPKSQSARAMGKEEFQRSKESVLEVVAGLVGVSQSELGKNAGKAA